MSKEREAFERSRNGRKTVKEDIIEWIEPLGDGSEPVILRAKAIDVAAVRRRQEPRYTSDEDAIDDFVIVHWAKRISVAPRADAEKDAALTWIDFYDDLTRTGMNDIQARALASKFYQAADGNGAALTDEQILEIYSALPGGSMDVELLRFARAILAANKEPK